MRKHKVYPEIEKGGSEFLVNKMSLIFNLKFVFLYRSITKDRNVINSVPVNDQSSNNNHSNWHSQNNDNPDNSNSNGRSWRNEKSNRNRSNDRMRNVSKNRKHR